MGNAPRYVQFDIQTTESGSYHLLSLDTPQTDGQMFTVRAHANGLLDVMGWNTDTVTVPLTTTTRLNDGQWHSVSVVYDGARCSISIDGEIAVVVDIEYDTVMNEGRLKVGCAPAATQCDFVGQMRNLQVGLGRPPNPVMPGTPVVRSCRHATKKDSANPKRMRTGE